MRRLGRGDHRGGLEHVEGRARIATASGRDVFEGRVIDFDPKRTQASIGIGQGASQQVEKI